MNARLIHLLFGTAIALGIACSLLVWPIATRAAPPAALPMSAPAPLAATTAVTFTVNTNLDGVFASACANNTPDHCTLREAILEADVTSGATIILPGLLAIERYQLTIPPAGTDGGTVGDLNANAAMIIVGKPTIQHPSVVIESLISDRVFNIGNGVPVNMSNVAIRNGKADIGGGIYNRGTLSLSNVTVISNTASSGGGGIYNAGNLTLNDSTIISNTATNAGGGIYNGANLTLNDSTVSGNTSGDAGGIFNGDTLALVNSTISANTTSNAGGGIYNRGVANLTFGTLNGNNASAGGGIYENINGFLTQTVTLRNTIVANSTGGNCATQNIALQSNGYNLSSDETCASYFNQAGDRNNANPNLGPLANNGGPTLTQMPQFPSPAMDAIPLNTNGCTTMTTDQRGFPRAADGKCDIGAVENGVLLLHLPLIKR